MRLVKGHSDPAGLQPDAFRQISQVLPKDLEGRLDQQLRPLQALPSQLRQGSGDLTAALALVVAVTVLGEPAEMGDKSIAIGESVGANAVHNAGEQDLLGAAAADAEEEFDGGAIDERAGKNLQFPDHVIDFAVPGRLCGHGRFTC